MPIINPLGINNETIVEIIDFMNDPKFNPKNQSKYFFDDSMSYYQQLCKVSKLLTDFQQAFAIVYQNEVNLANSINGFVTEEDLNTAISTLQTSLQAEITALSNSTDTRFASVNALLTEHGTAISTINTALTSLTNRVSAVETGLANKLQDVVITGDNITVVSKSTTEGVETIELAVQSGAGGTVTQINSGTGLTGGPITSSGTLAVDTTVVALKSDLPTKISDLTNDSGFITKAVDDLTNYTLSSALSTVATSGSYNDLSNRPTIPDGPVAFSNVSISGTPTSNAQQSWDSNNEFLYHLDVTLTGMTATMSINSFVVPISLLDRIAPFVESGAGYLRLFFRTNGAVSSTLIDCVAQEV